MTDVTVFEHFLANDQLTMEEIYTNMTELLLSGVDTVGVFSASFSVYINNKGTAKYYVTSGPGPVLLTRLYFS